MWEGRGGRDVLKRGMSAERARRSIRECGKLWGQSCAGEGRSPWGHSGVAGTEDRFIGNKDVPRRTSEPLERQTYSVLER